MLSASSVRALPFDVPPRGFGKKPETILVLLDHCTDKPGGAEAGLRGNRVHRHVEVAKVQLASLRHLDAVCPDNNSTGPQRPAQIC